MYPQIKSIIETFREEQISQERSIVLKRLLDYVQDKHTKKEAIRLHFICTHNSRRSHLAQIWAKTLASYFNLSSVSCYSGGTEVSALFPAVVDALVESGFEINKISESHNPVYSIKFDDNEEPIICFSKKYNHRFNPLSGFAAILTCNSADEACPVVLGAEARIPITYEDPKIYDETAMQAQKYKERSLEIAKELWWVFSKVV